MVIPAQEVAQLGQPPLCLCQCPKTVIKIFFELIMQGVWVQQCRRLHFREMLEPTGTWATQMLDQAEAMVTLEAAHRRRIKK